MLITFSTAMMFYLLRLIYNRLHLALAIRAMVERTVQAAFGPAQLPDPLKRVMVDFDALVLRRALGSGAFGDVCEAEWRGTPCAVKRLQSFHEEGTLKEELVSALGPQQGAAG